MYQGWKNYQTWAVALWLDNEQESHEYWTVKATDFSPENAYQLGDLIQASVQEKAPELGNTLYADLLNNALSEVDWREIALHFIDKY